MKAPTKTTWFHMGKRYYMLRGLIDGLFIYQFSRIFVDQLFAYLPNYEFLGASGELPPMIQRILFFYQAMFVIFYSMVAGWIKDKGKYKFQFLLFCAMTYYTFHFLGADSGHMSYYDYIFNVSLLIFPIVAVLFYDLIIGRLLPSLKKTIVKRAD